MQGQKLRMVKRESSTYGIRGLADCLVRHLVQDARVRVWTKMRRQTILFVCKRGMKLGLRSVLRLAYKIYVATR
jgi:hypothetical protein